MGAIFESTKIFEEQKPPSASLKKFKDETALHMAGRIWRPFANEPFTTVHDFKSVKAIAELVDSLLSILDRAKGQSDDRIYHYAAITICNQLIDEITGDNKPSYVEIRDGVKVFNDRFAYLLNEFYTKSPGLSLFSCPSHSLFYLFYKLHISQIYGRILILPCARDVLFSS